jgi:hypothetical protein
MARSESGFKSVSSLKCEGTATLKKRGAKPELYPLFLNNIFFDAQTDFYFYLQAFSKRRFSRQIRTSNTLLPGTE